MPPFTMPSRFYNVIVLNLDGVPDSQGDIFDQSTHFEMPRRIPVRKNFEISSPMGWADIRVLDTQFVVDLELFGNESPAGLYPAIGGHVISREGKKILSCAVNHISLSDWENADPRIQKLS